MAQEKVVAANPIRVLIVDNEFNMGGSEKKLFDFVRRTDRDRVHLSVCCLKDGGYFQDELVGMGVSFHDRLLGHRFDALAFRRFAGVLRRETPQIIYTMAHPNTVLFSWLARARGLVDRVVVSFHAMGRADGGRLVPYYLRPFLVDADALLAVGEAHRDYLAREEGMPPGLVEVIHNGVDTEHYHPPGPDERAAARAGFGLEDDAVAIVVVGSLKPLKRQGWLLDTVAPWMRNHPDARILFAGDGPDRAALEERARGLGLAGQVRFLGIRADVDVLLRAGDALVLPSRTEVFPNVVLEAMASGLPVVATGVGCVAEMVEDGVSGIVVDRDDADALRDAFAALAGDPGMRARFGARGREIAKAKFPIESMCEKRERLFERLARM